MVGALTTSIPNMDHQTLAAHLDLLIWRDEQLEATTDQLEAALPELVDSVASLVDEAGTVELLKTSVTLRKSVDNHVKAWAAEQARVATKRAEIALDATISSLGTEIGLADDFREVAVAGLGATSGLAIIGGSLATIPTALTFATVTTGGFFGFFATASFSVPLLAIGALGVGVLSFTGSTVVHRAKTSARNKLKSRLLKAVEQQVMGYGMPVGQRTVLSDIQAMIIRAGENKIEDLT